MNTPTEACQKLVTMALERGGPDNITVLVLRVFT
jgi:serine/threonine protein phosphatase PrpC